MFQFGNQIEYFPEITLDKDLKMLFWGRAWALTLLAPLWFGAWGYSCWYVRFRKLGSVEHYTVISKKTVLAYVITIAIFTNIKVWIVGMT